MNSLELMEIIDLLKSFLYFLCSINTIVSIGFYSGFIDTILNSKVDSYSKQMAIVKHPSATFLTACLNGFGNGLLVFMIVIFLPILLRPLLILSITMSIIGDIIKFNNN